MLKRTQKTHAFLFILIFFFIPITCNASQAADVKPITIIELTETHNNIFIGTITSKTETTDRTHYVFNVTEYLKHPVNSSQIYLTCGGGSEIAVSPDISFFLGIEYVMFVDEIDDEYSISGRHYSYRLLNSVDVSVIKNVILTHQAMEATSTSQVVASHPLVSQEEAELLAVEVFEGSLDDPYGVKITKSILSQIEYPWNSGTFVDTWRVDVHGNGFDMSGNHVTRDSIIYIVIENGEVILGLSTGMGLVKIDDPDVVGVHVEQNYSPIFILVGVLSLAILLRFFYPSKHV